MGKLNQKLAEDLKFTAKMNRKLVEHYYNYPDAPDGFPQVAKDFEWFFG